jgi:Flp pilus assembly protein TadD
VDEIDRLARRFAERSLGLDSTNVDVRMMLADVLANQLGRTDIAAVVLRAVLRDQPDHVGAMTLLGSIYAQTGLGAPGEAKQLLEKAKELAPNVDFAASCGLGAAAEAKGDLTEARKQFQAAWAIDQRSPELCLRIAKLLLQTGQYARVRDQLLPCLPMDSMGHARLRPGQGEVPPGARPAYGPGRHAEPAAVGECALAPREPE